MVADGRPINCLACHSTTFSRIEQVSIGDVAAAWQRENAFRTATSVDELRKSIQDDTQCQMLSIWRCEQCQLEIADPFRAWSASHYPTSNDGIGYDHLVVLKDLANVSSRRILDIGCGDGGFLQRAQKQHHQVAGLDFSAADVTLVRSHGIDARVGNVSNFKTCFPEQEPFSVVTMFQVIEHLTDPEETMSSIDAIAAPASVLYIGCPSNLRFSRVFRHPLPLQRNDFWDYPPQHTLRWTHSSLAKFLARHRWHVEWIRYEPLSVIGAAAYMTALHGRAGGWYGRSIRRKLNTLTWLSRIAVTQVARPMTGIRMVLKARRDVAPLAPN